ncbi:MAG: hypothetical protein ACQETH_11690 [Candidatus Rifleibacteriota bacterium]
MLRFYKSFRFISLLLVLTMLVAPVVQAAELSLFDRLKLKTEQKIEQVQQRDWWITKAVGKAVGFVAGKAGGGIGAAVGYLIGAGMGGPVVAGMGAMIGFRIGDIVTQIFAEAVSNVVTQWKLKDKREVNLTTVTEALRVVDAGALTAESVGAVVGDLVGGTMGAAAGIAFFAGCGPVALPILGTFTSAYIGSKIGTSIFSGIGSWIGSKSLKKGYEAYAGREPKIASEDSDISETDFNNDFRNESEEEAQISESEADSKDKSISDKNVNTSISDARQEYEKAYKAYTEAMISGADSEEATRKLQVYREALERYRAIISTVQSNR